MTGFGMQIVYMSHYTEYSGKTPYFKTKISPKMKKKRRLFEDCIFMAHLLYSFHADTI